MNENILKKVTSVHFIGIGGSGVSAVARMFLFEGKTVSGSDHDESDSVKELRKEGVVIKIGEKKENIPEDCDLVIYSKAIPLTHAELKEAKQRKIPLFSYPEALNLISQGKYTIAIAGTAGKTTTTAMVGKILKDAGLDPTVIVGGVLLAEKTNFVYGKSKYLVVEADEYRKSFHNLTPTILVITNIDEDHLDYYKDLADIQSSFAELTEKIGRNGFLVCNKKDSHVEPILKIAKCNMRDYEMVSLENVRLAFPGKHNRENAKAAFVVGDILGIDSKKIKKSLAEFTGTARRFEYKGQTKNGALVYDDYAHNPKKIEAAIEGARAAFPDKSITLVFQPHLYSRTKIFLHQFASALSKADRILLVPIYAAREQSDPTISSRILADEISKFNKNTLYFSHFEEIAENLKNLSDNNLIIIMGAGDVHKIVKLVVES